MAGTIKLWCTGCIGVTQFTIASNLGDHNTCTLCGKHFDKCRGCWLEADHEEELHYEQDISLPDAEIATKFECTKCNKEQYVTPEIKLLAAIFGEYVCTECTRKEEVREQIMVNGKPLSEYLKEE